MFPLIWPVIAWTIGGAIAGGAVGGAVGALWDFLYMSDQETQAIADYLNQNGYRTLNRVFVKLVNYRTKVRRVLKIEVGERSREKTISQQKFGKSEMPDDVRRQMEKQGTVTQDHTQEVKKQLAY